MVGKVNEQLIYLDIYGLILTPFHWNQFWAQMSFILALDSASQFEVLQVR